MFGGFFQTNQPVEKPLSKERLLILKEAILSNLNADGLFRMAAPADPVNRLCKDVHRKSLTELRAIVAGIANPLVVACAIKKLIRQMPRPMFTSGEPLDYGYRSEPSAMREAFHSWLLKLDALQREVLFLCFDLAATISRNSRGEAMSMNGFCRMFAVNFLAAEHRGSIHLITCATEFLDWIGANWDAVQLYFKHPIFFAHQWCHFKVRIGGNPYHLLIGSAPTTVGALYLLGATNYHVPNPKLRLRKSPKPTHFALELPNGNQLRLTAAESVRDSIRATLRSAAALVDEIRGHRAQVEINRSKSRYAYLLGKEHHDFQLFLVPETVTGRSQPTVIELTADSAITFERDAEGAVSGLRVSSTNVGAVIFRSISQLPLLQGWLENGVESARARAGVVPTMATAAAHVLWSASDAEKPSSMLCDCCGHTASLPDLLTCTSCHQSFHLECYARSKPCTGPETRLAVPDDLNRPILQPRRLPRFPYALAFNRAQAEIATPVFDVRLEATLQMSERYPVPPSEDLLSRENWALFKLAAKKYPCEPGLDELLFLQTRSDRAGVATNYRLVVLEPLPGQIPTQLIFQPLVEGQPSFPLDVRALRCFATPRVLSLRRVSWKSYRFSAVAEDAFLVLTLSNEEERRLASILRALVSYAWRLQPTKPLYVEEGDRARALWLHHVRESDPFPRSLRTALLLMTKLSTVETVLAKAVCLAGGADALLPEAVWPAFPHRPLVLAAYTPELQRCLPSAEVMCEEQLRFLRVEHRGWAYFSKEDCYAYLLVLEKLDYQPITFTLSLLEKMEPARQVDADNFGELALFYEQLPPSVPLSVKSHLASLYVVFPMPPEIARPITSTQLVDSLLASIGRVQEDERALNLVRTTFFCLRELFDDLTSFILELDARASSSEPDRERMTALIRYWWQHHTRDDFPDSGLGRSQSNRQLVQAVWHKVSPEGPALADSFVPIQPRWAPLLKRHTSTYEAREVAQALVLPFGQTLLDFAVEMVALNLEAFLQLPLASLHTWQLQQPFQSSEAKLRHRAPLLLAHPDQVRRVAEIFLFFRDAHAFGTLRRLAEPSAELTALLQAMHAEFVLTTGPTIPFWPAFLQRLQERKPESPVADHAFSLDRFSDFSLLLQQFRTYQEQLFLRFR